MEGGRIYFRKPIRFPPLSRNGGVWTGTSQYPSHEHRGGCRANPRRHHSPAPLQSRTIPSVARNGCFSKELVGTLPEGDCNRRQRRHSQNLHQARWFPLPSNYTRRKRRGPTGNTRVVAEAGAVCGPSQPSQWSLWTLQNTSSDPEIFLLAKIC